MRTSSAKGALLLMLSQAAQLATQIVSLVVLSRMLPASAFGLVAMVSTVVGLASVLTSFGLSLSALAGAPPDQAERSNLFWLNSAAGFACMVLIAACGPVLSSFYHQHALIGVTAALSIPFFVGGLSVQFKIELNLAKRWWRLATVQALPGFVALVVAAIIAAVTGSYWALVIQSLVSAIFQLALVLVLCEWRPSRPRRRTGMRRHFVFGRDTVVVQALNYIASNADNVLIGRSLGSASLGEYNRAFNLAVMPLSQISLPLEQIILPRLSAALGEGFEEVMVRCHRVMAYAQLLPLSLLAGTAYPLVGALLGARWAAVPGLIQVLAIGSASLALSYIFWWVLLAHRRTGVIVLSEGPFEIAMVIVMAIVVKYGSIDVAWCMAAGQTGILLASTALCRRTLGINVAALARASVTPLLLGIVSAVVADEIGRASWWPDHLIALIAAVLAWLVIWALAWTLSARVREDFRLAIDLIRSRKPPEPVPPTSPVEAV